MRSKNTDVSRRGAEAQRDSVALDSRPSTLDAAVFTWQPTPAAMAMLDRPLINGDAEDDLHEITLIRQPKTAKAGAALYGSAYDPNRCLRAITTAIGFWQCGHPRGKGNRGLYCGRHA